MYTSKLMTLTLLAFAFTATVNAHDTTTGEILITGGATNVFPDQDEFDKKMDTLELHAALLEKTIRKFNYDVKYLRREPKDAFSLSDIEGNEPAKMALHRALAAAFWAAKTNGGENIRTNEESEFSGSWLEAKKLAKLAGEIIRNSTASARFHEETGQDYTQNTAASALPSQPNWNGSLPTPEEMLAGGFFSSN